MGLPPIEDENDLPDPQDIPGYIHVRLSVYPLVCIPHPPFSRLAESRECGL